MRSSRVREVVELRVARSTAVVQQALRQEFLGSPVSRASDMQARTDGDGVPPLRSAILYHIVVEWEAFADIRAVERALSQKSRLHNALSIDVNSARVALAAAALCADRSASTATVLLREDDWT